VKPVVVSLVVIWALLGGTVAASQSDEVNMDLDGRVRAFARQVRCLVCQNETLADSQAGLADDLRREIRDQMRAGQTDDEIAAYLTQRYGDFVLYRPPLKPSTYVLWFGPFVLLGAGVLTLARLLTRRPMPHPAGMSARLRKRAHRLLEEAPPGTVVE
jgi:cytochrome c-type biogenesis protein CcmH